MKIGDIVKCDDWVFDGAIGLIIELMSGRVAETNGVRILTPKGFRRVSIHNIKVISESR
jgi:hypothetical protein